MVTIRYNEVEDKFYLIDGDKTTECKVNKDYRDGPIIKLPPNSANRQYLMVKKFHEVAIDNEVQLSEKEYKSPVTGKIPKKPTVHIENWTDYLTEEEKITMEEIKAKAMHRMNSPIEKARREVERAQAALDALLKAAQDEQAETIDEELGELEE